MGGVGDYIAPLRPAKSNKARCDFAEEIYNACLAGNEAAGRSIWSKNATWLPILREAIRNTSEESVTAREWTSGIAREMADASIEWVPGCHRKRLTSRRVIQLDKTHLYAKPPPILSGPPGSLKGAAMEAELRMTTADEQASKRSNRGRIDFGYEIPFKKVPKAIQEGFAKLETYYSMTDLRAVRHLDLAYSCLLDCLGDPLCDLMFMLALTFAACTVTPLIREGEAEFSPGTKKKKKDAEMLSATMVTRMLWFMRSERYPWEDHDRGVLSVAKMTQKLGE